MRKIHWSVWVWIAVFFVTALVAYPFLPSVLASHWDASGNVNGSMSRFWGDFGIPFLFVFLMLVFVFIPRLDPNRQSIAKFQGAYGRLVGWFAMVFYYIYLLTLFWNFGYRFDLMGSLIIGLAVLFYMVGVFLPQTELNYMIGIRTPWTIANETVWKKTHILGGKLFRISAFIALLGVLFPTVGLWFLLVPVLGSSIWLVIYSYLLYAKLPAAAERS